MTRLFRSKSSGLVGLTPFNTAPPTSFFNSNNGEEDEDDDEDEEEVVEEGREFEEQGIEDEALCNPISTQFITPGSKTSGNHQGRHCHQNGHHNHDHDHHQFAILDILVAALRKSIVTCSVEREDVSSSLDISWPTEVRHVSHVTFDRFNGFLGLPTELEPEVPRRVPSASASVFGVSAQSMQCTYDNRGNSVPTILLMMQKRLYSGGGLQAEGIFRISGENSQEEKVRDALNKGLVPHEIDVYCLADLIKAWFRELPTGVLDSLTPEQIVHCNTEDDCTKLEKLLPPTEASLLDWAINLMADVVEHEQYNKMNARNIAMVFSPNMTQMADPLTALFHAVQVMNLLKTLILKTLREREESPSKSRSLSSCSKFPDKKTDLSSSAPNKGEAIKQSSDTCAVEQPEHGTSTLNSIESDIDEKLWCSHPKSDEEDNSKSRSDSNRTPEVCRIRESEFRDGYESGDWLSLRKGVRKLCRHPVFQLNKSAKKTATLAIVNTNTRERGGEAWA
ncbi:Rho GTPase-activating protein [Parasponia andersonii]|uniref:Rho GTPase-activating protein n=1 Tax=Parasponia andersonii TaxID=3476 RepID=A0A2P5DQA3_PARAD|nr:Rho GTPase-activating protein [Parasponia andersonii]